MRGIWTALITPFTDSNELDLPAFKKILQDQRAAGVTGVVPCGTTGEAPTLTTEEKKLLIRTAVDDLKGSGVQVVAGTGSHNTAETIVLSQWAEQQGVDGVLVVTPYYNKPSQAGLEAHFRQIAEAVNCEMILYNVPGRASVSLTAETIARLAVHPRIGTLKEATGNVAFTSEILDLLQTENGQLEILSGDDATFLPLLSVGAVGVISVASNLFPRAMVALQAAFENNRPDEALKIHRRFYPLFRDLFLESNPVPIKQAMAWAGWCKPHLRLPLVALSKTNEEKLQSSLTHCGLKRGIPA
jgi:4-hydroxy-tetrahydrodipicolinate synthase